MFSANLRAVSWKTIGWGIVLQLALAVLVLKVPAVANGFRLLANGVDHFIHFTHAGSVFVFGNLADLASAEFGRLYPEALFPGKNDKGEDNYLFQFAFVALPPILFVSAFFTVLYHFGVPRQFIVRFFAKGMVYLPRARATPETLVRGCQRVHRSDGSPAHRPALHSADDDLGAVHEVDDQRGFAHISGGMMVVYDQIYGGRRRLRDDRPA